MKIEILTTQHLEELKNDILKEIKDCLQVRKEEETWLKSCEVRKKLDCSEGTLVNLRAKGLLPYSKINGTLYYKNSDLHNLLNSNLIA